MKLVLVIVDDFDHSFVNSKLTFQLCFRLRVSLVNLNESFIWKFSI